MDFAKFQSVLQSLKAIGVERIAAIAIALAMIAGILGAASYFTAKSGFETLYVGLSQQDVSRMGAALSEAGISFETSLDGTKIGVPLGQASEARALLAVKGLPGSPNSGYELFDKMGPLGLTSYMQEITRLRALEGELARTIQHIKGVRSARVHLVLPEAGSLRNKKQSPSASVVISAEGLLETTVTAAIRHVVAAAIPEMTPDQVSVVGTDGRLLAGGGSGGASEMSMKLIELERQVAEQLQLNIRRTLTPYFGPGNFEVSALARLNIDKRQLSETNYDPDKRVERSVRVVKEAESSQAASGSSSVSVEQNIPKEGAADGGKEQSKRAQDRKEETTNYEISSKSATTMSDGYRIEKLSVAIVLNRKRVAEILGKEPSESDVKTQVAEIEKLVTSAAGLDSGRGDSVNIAAVNFASDPLALESSEVGGWAPMLFGLAATLVKSLTVLAVAAIIVWAGLRPLTRTLLANAPAPALGASGSVSALEGPPLRGSPSMVSGPSSDMPQMVSPLLESNNPFGSQVSAQSSWGSESGMANGPVERLSALLEQDEEHAATVLKHWVRTG